ncbi:energy-coupling factor ABC transporter ATP-binding protein [Actinopolymorpha alba]|uniref:energy-coupling factor ABC transporter ATP-binding protein n=1 Tax=Actinopolymorpha alba TaxID=533267 RepID=UPI0003740545|nr:ATP-binding cassette domain-containing protein [Actinopolymorpha alba]
MSDPIIAFEDVSFTYAGSETPALSNIDLAISEGEYVAILGLNGAGKTTLGLCVNGVVPHMLGGELTGEVRVAGLNVADYAVREMAKVVGIVFDNPEFQMSQLTVAEEVALGMENTGVSYAEMRRVIPEVLAQVGLAGFEERTPLGLSGGQQQRLAIAAVLAMKPRVLVLDEPTSNLDPVGKQDVFEIAERLNREQGMTVIIAEHEVEVVARYADRIVVLDQGRVVLNGPPKDVLSQVERLTELHLRPPQATRIAELLRDEHHLWDGPLPVLAEDAATGIEAILGRSA